MNLSLNIFTPVLDMGLIISFNNLTSIFKEYPTVPAMERDISLITNKSILSSDIVDLISKVGKPLVENVELVDRYEGHNIANNKVSQAFRITYRKKQSTLTEKEVSPVHEKIRIKLSEKFNAMFFPITPMPTIPIVSLMREF